MYVLFPFPTQIRPGKSLETALVHKGFGRIAQLVEQLTLNQRVVGSNPTAPTNDFKGLALEQNRTLRPFYNFLGNVLQILFSLCSSRPSRFPFQNRRRR